jgi:hypothetical protein
MRYTLPFRIPESPAPCHTSKARGAARFVKAALSSSSAQGQKLSKNYKQIPGPHPAQKKMS